MTPDPIGLEGGINLFVYVENNPINFIDPEGLSKDEVIVKGSYKYVKHPGDTYHGGKHWHVLKRKGGKLIGRVGLDGKILTGSIPKTALKNLIKMGKIGGAAFGIVLELALPAEAGAPEDMIPESDDPCKK